MFKKAMVVWGMAIGAGLITTQAQAWDDVEYTGTLGRGAVYCTSQGKLERFAEFAQDGDYAAGDRMVEAGDCTITQQPMRVIVFQEHQGFLSCFLSPSGKAFYTFKQFIN